MSSNFTFDIKIPVDPNFDEREASKMCEERSLDFSRIDPENFMWSIWTYEPFYIYCIAEIQGWSVSRQYS